MLKHQLGQWGLTLACCAMLLMAAPAKAQLTLDKILQTTAQSRLTFAPYTVGSVISGGGDRVYVLNATKDQFLSIDIHSMGARAFVAVYDPTGKQLALLNGLEPTRFEYELPVSGDYYIFCYSGPTIHFYDFTIRVQ